MTDHICYKCPNICNSCTSPTNCKSCISGYYLQNGACLSQCTGLYYANTTSMKCVTSNNCKPYFGVNSTNMCQSTCPTGSFPNSTLYRCDACPSTCITCSSLKNCSTCTNQAQFYNNACYGFCNSTNIYYDKLNTTCLT
jgi:proprotein convertase subtilisin/kexin type 5